ncbi:MAG: EamA family transporter RarD [Deltaproteobacteria bacterium]|nr:EamA family transporter RarD [Deltaproteobacteria bacterium]MBW1749023.1 EamA family transporter RarD [Deltaproteobacteria bacterium]MBW1970176.1 EamA family transporter RarD [Deltaproteobacteria bacterium]MBW2155775.1 EamA family transporter RarD [Deltaproteobacteria bacterium]MBW2226661.1 EamA family transporter RarD [Deltaproteobacteria bacterium]
MKSQQESLSGVAYASAAFLIWGLSPIYWKVLHNIPALEIIMHRTIWSFVFLLTILVFLRQGNAFIAAVKKRRTFLVLIPTTILLAFNWFIYIWAVNNEHILQASLGYFITPLVNVLLGMIFLGERMRPLQTVSLVLAGISVLYLTVYYGKFPWIAIALALAFGFYGLIRKMAPIGSLVGLSLEIFFLSGPALAYLIFLDSKDIGALFHMSIKMDLFLMGTAFLTAFPLLLFTLGTRRLNLSTVGFLQYIAPSCMFLLGVFLYNEPISSAQTLTFVLIWTALCIYSTDSVRYYRRIKNPVSSNFSQDGSV